jgi:hypothetical protein
LPAFLQGFLIRFWDALLDVFTTRSTKEFERFTAVALPGSTSVEPAPAIVNVAPLTKDDRVSNPAECEELFTRLIQAGRFDTAWDLLTPDSQATWQRRDVFKQEMETRQPARDLLGSKVREVRFLPSWTDKATLKTYHQVAELVVDYRIRNASSREMVVTRDVHLVNVSGGWKSLCYRS